MGSGNLRFGSPLKFPDYDICCDELDDIANDSHFAKMALETGDARLSEIPEELMAEDAGEERAKWLEDKLLDIRKDVEREFIAKIREMMNTEDLSEKCLKEFGNLATYRNVLLHKGISDPDGTLRKAIEEGALYPMMNWIGYSQANL